MPTATVPPPVTDRIARLRATGSRAACGAALDLMTGWQLAQMAPVLGFVAHDGDTQVELSQRALNVLFPPGPVPATSQTPATDDRYEQAVEAARRAYWPAYEQGMLSDIASCSEWFGWHAAIKAASTHMPEIAEVRVQVAGMQAEIDRLRREIRETSDYLDAGLDDPRRGRDALAEYAAVRLRTALGR